MTHRTDRRLAILFAAIASAGAGVIHVAVLPSHWQEWAPSGVFFLAIALFQFGWAAISAAGRTRPALLTLGAAVNLGSLMLWAVSRTWGVPFGPHANEPEAIGVPGLLATALEACVVASVAWALRKHDRQKALSTAAYRAFVGVSAMLVVLLLVPGVLTGLSHGHGGSEHGGGGHDGHHEPGTHHEAPERTSPSAVTDSPEQTTDGHGEHGDHEGGHSHG